MDTPGIEVRPLVDMTGVANFNETSLPMSRVPKHQIVGERGEGWMVANAILGHERDSLGNPNITPEPPECADGDDEDGNRER